MSKRVNKHCKQLKIVGHLSIFALATEMTVTFFEFLTTLLIVNIGVLCAERRLWSLAEDSKYSYFDDRRRQEMLEATRHMFHFGYDSYMTHAFPKDELDPIHCTGRGPDYDNPYAKVVASNTCSDQLPIAVKTGTARSRKRRNGKRGEYPECRTGLG